MEDIASYAVIAILVIFALVLCSILAVNGLSGADTAPVPINVAPNLSFIEVDTPRGTIPCITLTAGGISCDWSGSD